MTRIRADEIRTTSIGSHLASPKFARIAADRTGRRSTSRPMRQDAASTDGGLPGPMIEPVKSTPFNCINTD